MTVGAASVVVRTTKLRRQFTGITVSGDHDSHRGDLHARAAAASPPRSGLNVSSGGHLIATGTNFAWDTFNLADGSVLNRGDLAGDTFNQTISVPITDVPLLAGNVVFNAIDINPPTSPAGPSS